VSVHAASGDRLDADNTRYLVADVAERVEVLIVAGRRTDGRFLADALDPDPTDRSALRPRVITEGELAETDLAPFACVFLSNVAQLTASETERLSDNVRQGRGLAVFLGDRVVADSYNAAADGGKPLMPARLGDVRAESRFGVDPLDYRHPIVAPFRGQERAGLLSTPVARYFQLILPDDRPQTEVAMATPGGDPLVVTAPLGRGQVVLVATAGSLASIDAASGEPWTAWPAWPSFLPVVRTMLAYAVDGAAADAQRVVGEPLGGHLTWESSSGGEPLELIRPDGQTVAVHTTPSAVGREWNYADTKVSGVYTLRDPAAGDTQRFAVNADTRESDLAQLAPDRLPPELMLQRDARAGGEYNGGSILPAMAWHRPLLWSALSLVFVELCLAWLFGRGGR
jgi:hypothetical protein